MALLRVASEYFKDPMIEVGTTSVRTRLLILVVSPSPPLAPPHHTALRSCSQDQGVSTKAGLSEMAIIADSQVAIKIREFLSNLVVT